MSPDSKEILHNSMYRREPLHVGGRRQVPDAAILRSLPGIGTGVLATLLAEGSDALRRRDYDALRCLCGVAPVTRGSGKNLLVVRRLAAHCQRSFNFPQVWSSKIPPPVVESNNDNYADGRSWAGRLRPVQVAVGARQRVHREGSVHAPSGHLTPTSIAVTTTR